VAKVVLVVLVGILLGATIPVLALAFSKDNVLRVIAGLGGATLSTILCYLGYLWCVSDFRMRFKVELISPLIRFFGADLSYTPAECIRIDLFEASHLFGEVDRLGGQDYIAGTAGKTKFQACEVCAQEESVTEKEDGSRKTSYNTVFAGLFFVGDFNKEFSGSTIVMPQTAHNAWATTMGQLVKLEDPEFSRLFTVYSSDQILARYVLSPSLMRRIVEYRGTTDRDIHLSFIDGVLYVAVKTGSDLFEPRLLSPVDAGQYMNAFDDFHMVLGIIEELNLNTRIWTKR